MAVLLELLERSHEGLQGVIFPGGFLSNNLLFNQLTNNNLIYFASTSYWNSPEMDCSS